MDGPLTDADDLARAVDELAVVHDWFGGARCARFGVQALFAAGQTPEPLRVLDIGCGGGELARRAWLGRPDTARDRPLASRAILVDFNRDACRLARAKCLPEDIVLQSDAFHLPIRPGSVDMVHCGLFLHHFDVDRAAGLVADLLPLCRLGLVVSDLHRHRLPYICTGWGTRLLSRSAMVRHDAPLSVARGFRRQDLEEIAQRAGFRWTVLRRVWPWRWLAVKRVDRA